MPERDKKEIRLLVVDDEASVRDMLRFELNALGYQVSVAGDGAEAVAFVRSHPVDLVITDMKMPKMDGVQTLDEIKKIDPSIPVIVLTGFGTLETAVATM